MCGKFELQIETVKEVVSTIKIGIKIQLGNTPISFRISLGVLPSHRHHQFILNTVYLVSDQASTFKLTPAVSGNRHKFAEYYQKYLIEDQ